MKPFDPPLHILDDTLQGKINDILATICSSDFARRGLFEIDVPIEDVNDEFRLNAFRQIAQFFSGGPQSSQGNVVFFSKQAERAKAHQIAK